jgi:ribonuclease BN (tRNA processing enzyme)
MGPHVIWRRQGSVRNLLLTHLLPGTDPAAARAAARHGYDGEVGIAAAGSVIDLG